jgi:predicted metal-binding membrane protein
VSSEYASARTREAKRLPLAALGVSAIAWMVLFAVAGSHLYGMSMSPGETIGSMLEFLGTWETMVIAMMLPSSFGFFVLFQTATGDSRSSTVRSVALCVGYSLVWLVVGCVAVIMSDTLYRLDGLSIWLGSHANVLAGGVLALAGYYQFSTLKRRCLVICSHPANFFMRYYRRGMGNAFMLGLRYGLVCLGCCWALMTVMVILGGDSLYMMMVLTVIMFAERAMGWSNRFASTVGLTCVALGALVATSPDTMPMFVRNASSWASMGSMQLAHHGWSFWCHV